MWQILWEDFRNRAKHLSEGGTVRDAIDQTVAWQLDGHPTHVGSSLPLPDLHLPELYSGSSWRYTQTWVAFLGLNPSLDAEEVYPTLQHAAGDAWHRLVPFFEDRFHLRCDAPLTHGRDATGRVAIWRRGGSGTVRAARSRTLTILDRVLGDAARVAGQKDLLRPLGSIGAIFDAVPWKFRKWGELHPSLRADLVTAARPYLTWSLQTHHAAVLVTLGLEAWAALSAIYPEMEKHAAGPTHFRRAHVTHWTGDSALVIGVHHATRQGFNRVRHDLVQMIGQEFIRLGLVVRDVDTSSGEIPLL